MVQLIEERERVAARASLVFESTAPSGSLTLEFFSFWVVRSNGGLGMTDCEDTNVQAVSGSTTAIEAAVICLVNEARANEGLQPLTLNAKLRGVARDQAQAANAIKWWPSSGDTGRIPHINPVTHKDQFQRIRDSGYCGGSDVHRNENAYAAYFTGNPVMWGTGTTAAAAVDWWLHSPDHRANILDPEFTETGVGVVHGTASTGLDPGSDGGIFVQCFGGCAEPEPTVSTTLWAWGHNGEGQVGDGNAGGHALTPTHPTDFEDFVAVAANNISVGVKADGTVWTWGPNDIDDPTAGGSDKPTRVDGVDGVLSVSAGEKHVLAVRNDGTVWAWGDNSGGQLGDGSGQDQLRPVRVRHLDGVKMVAAGNDFSLALRADGTVWGWGFNGDAQFGMETPSADGTLPYDERRFPIHLTCFDNPVAAIAAGFNYTAVIEEGTGQLLLCGLNLAGCIGAGDPGQVFYAEPTKPVPTGGFTGADIVSVAASFYNTYAVDRGGKVWAWGNNTFDQWGPGTQGQPEDGLAHHVRNVPSAVSVSAGMGHAMVQTQSGQLWTWGSNAGGQLGHGAYAVTNPPGWCSLDGIQAFAAGVYHSLAIAHRAE